MCLHISVPENPELIFINLDTNILINELMPLYNFKTKTSKMLNTSKSLDFRV